MPHIAIYIDRQVSSTAADVTDCHAHLAFLFGEHHFTRSERVQHELLDLHACCSHTLTQVVTCSGRGSDNVCFHFQAIAMHPFRVADPILAIYGEPALDDMDDLTVMRDRH